MICYSISGLGADHRVFKHLDIGMELRPVPWLIPYPDESLHQYAKRLSMQIDPSRPFALLGLSFGGVLAAEIAQFMKPEKVILISTLESKTDLSPFLRGFPLVGINPLFGIRKTRVSIAVMNWLFGVTQVENKRLLKKFIMEAPPALLRWSLHQVMTLKTQLPVSNAIRIHGDNDRLIPLKKNTQLHVVNKGGHFMVIENPEEVSALIRGLLN